MDSLDSGSHGSEFLNEINDCFMWQHVKVPTRRKNILDLILSTEKNMISDVVVSCPISNSDHNLITFRLDCGMMEEVQNCKNFRYDKANFPKIQEALSSIDWVNAFMNKTLEDMWELFITELHDKRNKYVPVAKTRKRVFPK